MKEIFTDIYYNNRWGSAKSRSGEGSEIERTVEIREQLPRLFNAYGVNKILDIGCGDFNWMKTIIGDREYLGVDIIDGLIDLNNFAYGTDKIKFVSKNILELDFSFFCGYDCVIIRDVFVHLSLDSIRRVLNEIYLGEIPYIFTTNFLGCLKNQDIPDGHWRPLNLYLPPFGFGRPMNVIVSYSESYRMDGFEYFDKTLTMWSLPIIKTDKHHSFVNNIVKKQLRQINPMSVIDVGTGDGYWGKVVKLLLPKATLTGIELSSKWFDHCQELGIYDRLINDDMMCLTKLSGDVIIFGDVLEHVEKDKAMLTVREAVKRFKYIIINTPYGFQPQEHEDTEEVHRCGLTEEDFFEFEVLDWICYSAMENPVFNILIKGNGN